MDKIASKTDHDLILVVDPLSNDALQNLKFYKYSSVDKSPLSKYVLQHYVGLISLALISKPADTC